MSITVPNPVIYEGTDITAQATAPVLGGRFVAVSGSRTAGGNVAVAPAAAAGRVFGVAATDAAAGQLVRVVRGASRVVRVIAAGAIAANTEVQVAADGKATALAAGKAVGYTITAAVDGGEAQISFYA